MKIAPLLAALSSDKSFLIGHTGQHYDYAMSGQFFLELGIPSLTTIWKRGPDRMANRPLRSLSGWKKFSLPSVPKA